MRFGISLRGSQMWAMVGLLCTAPCTADTPMKARIPEGVVREIECSLTDREAALGTWKVLLSPGVYHYRVWLPKGYSRTPDDRYPALFVASPGGNAGMGNVERAAAERRWIVILLVESRNGGSPVAVGNFLAAHDDAVKRFRLQEGMKFVTGLSGGARIQSINAGLRPGFAGIILQGAGFLQQLTTGTYYLDAARQPAMCVFGIFGLNDPNILETVALDAELPKTTPRRFSCFNGGHDWAPPERMDDALDWVTFNALMKLDLSGDGSAYLTSLLTQALTLAQAKGPSHVRAALILTALGQVIEQRGLKDDPKFADQATKVEAERSRLAADPVVANELAAMADYSAIATEESDGLGLQRPDFQKGRPVNTPAGEVVVAAAMANPAQVFAGVLRRYDACAQRYPNTVYGRKAAARRSGSPRTGGRR